VGACFAAWIVYYLLLLLFCGFFLSKREAAEGVVTLIVWAEAAAVAVAVAAEAVAVAAVEDVVVVAAVNPFQTRHSGSGR
jgi:hypothetical protein